MSLRDVAKESTQKGGNPLLEGKEKVQVADIVATYPEGITITGATLIKKNNDEFPAFTFAEDDKSFFFGGTVLTNIFFDWLKAIGNEGDLNAELQKEPVKIRMYDAKNKNGRTYTAVEIL